MVLAGPVRHVLLTKTDKLNRAMHTRLAHTTAACSNIVDRAICSQLHEKEGLEEARQVNGSLAASP